MLNTGVSFRGELKKPGQMRKEPGEAQEPMRGEHSTVQEPDLGGETSLKLLGDILTPMVTYSVCLCIYSGEDRSVRVEH